MISKYADWIATGKYLPQPLRDFHDQKRLFKRIHVNVGRKIKKNMEERGYDSYLQGLNWCMAHVYVIDFFLWFMALHGYTLQRSRQRFAFDDLDETMQDFEKQQIEEYKDIFGKGGAEV
jgi:hypothetical protein